MIAPEQVKTSTDNLLNEEQAIHPLYAYLYVVDKYEGLILVNAATLLDGDPLNNYLKRALTFNPAGALDGANNIAIAGTYAYVTTEHGLAVIDIDNPLRPQLVGQIGAPALKRPRAIAVQFRYGFIVDEEGLKVLDLTTPEKTHLVENAFVRLSDARDVYVARTYAYVAGGREGVAIIDVEQPEKPRLDQTFNAEGKLNDARQVKIAMTNASLFAYVADGRNGLRILQLTSPETMPDYAGFSPRPRPALIATFKTSGDALAVSKGLDRDRAADESGNQIAVFGRRGARPFTLEEIQRMFRTEGGKGQFFTVKDRPPTAPCSPCAGTGTTSIAADAVARPPASIAVSLFVKPGKTTAILGGLGLFLLLIRRRYRDRHSSRAVKRITPLRRRP
jgi:hypothetical protein